MRHLYKKIVLPSMTAMLLTACGSNITENISGDETQLAKAQLGVLSGATVTIVELGAVPYKILYTETTSSGNSIATIGNFNAHTESYEKDKFYLLSVSGGLDMDVNDDGNIDVISTPNKGTFHAIVKGEDAKEMKGAFKVTMASEFVYKKVVSDIEDITTLEEKLDKSAKEILKKGTDETEEVSNSDILKYDPIKHKEHFQESYQDRLLEFTKDIHEDKKVEVKLSPTANAGIDKSILIGKDLELSGKGLDLDGQILTYIWSEDGKELSQQRDFIYATTTAGLHTLTLTVTDNDNLSGIHRVNITVSENPNSIPTAKSKTIDVEEDTKKGFTLEGSDTDGDTLTYKILTNPVYGQLSGKAPNLLYIPVVNFNGDDKFIFVSNDGKADSQKAIIHIHVKPSNDKPEILFDGGSISTKEDTFTRFTLKAEDQENDKLTYTIIQKPKSGTLTHKNDNFIYTPKANFYGKDSFTVSVKDGNGGEDSKVISVNVTPVNDSPIVDIGESKSMLAGASITLRAEAKDIDGKVVKYEWRENKKVLSNKASFVYKQENIGNHTITLTITDDKGATSTQRVVIHVNEVSNVKPKSEHLSIHMKEDTRTNIILKASDQDQDKLTYKIVQNPFHGRLSGRAPNISYAPSRDYFGKDYFTYRANDGKDDSNVAKVSITIENVIEVDKTAPVIDLHGPATINVIPGTKVVISEPTAKDARDGKVKVITTGKVNYQKKGTYTLIYTAIDKAGNKSTKTRTIKVLDPLEPKDRVAPVITLNGASVETVIQGSTYHDKGATAKDNVDGSVSVKYAGKVDTSKVGTYTRTYTATDKAGNKATKIRTVKVVAPTYKVTTTLVGTKLTVKWSAFPGSAYIYIGSGSGSSSYVGIPGSGEKVLTLDRAEYTINHYTLTIRNDKNKVVFTKKFDVKPTKIDKTAPVITLRGNIKPTLYVGDKYVEKGTNSRTGDRYKAYDKVDGSVYVIISGKVNTAKEGTYKITYTAVDKSGNKATKIRTIIVLRSKAPVIIIKGESNLVLFQGEKYIDSVQAEDDRDGIVHVTTSGKVDTSKPGKYTLTYTAVDSEGNKATKRRMVEVFKSEHKISTSFDEKNIIISWDSFPRVYRSIEISYEEQHSNGPTIRKQSVSSYTRRTGSRSIHLYEYNVDATITIYDSSKNVISTKHIKIPSEESLSPLPKITFTGKSGEDAISIKIGDTVHLPKPKAYSRKYGKIPVKIVQFASIYSKKSWPIKNTFVVTPDMATSGGTLIVRYLATDKDGNEGKGYIIYKVDQPDTREPRITLKGNFKWTDSGGTLRDYYPRQQITGSYKEDGATAIDDRDGKVSVKISYGKLTKSLFRAGKPSSTQGIYVVFYTAKDKAGNKSVKYRLVLRSLAAWVPSVEYEIAVNKYIKDHLSEF